MDQSEVYDDHYYAEGEENGEEEGEYGFGELEVAPVFHGNHVDVANVLRFDAIEETLWAGTQSGVVTQLISPHLEPHAVVAAHPDSILAIRSMGHSCVSLSPFQLSLHYSGCVPRLWHTDEVGDLSALELEHRGYRAVMGRSGGGICGFDLAAGRPTGTADTGGQGVVALCGPLSRGGIVSATADGKFSIIDGRNAYRPTGASLLAHSGGFAAIDAAGDLVATAGYLGRLGRVSLETTVKVFDARMGLRMLANLPFQAGPTLLRFHPAFSTTLLVGSASGMFTICDASGVGGSEIFAVDSGGDALLACDVSPSGECIAFAGAGGYVHLWAASNEPSVNVGGEAPTGAASPPEEPPPSLREDEPFVAVAPHFPPDGSALASDVGLRETMAAGLPPRTLDPVLLSTGKQTDFVAHVENPKHVRGSAPGHSAAAVAKLRNQRVKPRPMAGDAEAARAARAAERAAAGGVILPGRYRRVVIKQQTGVKFEEFDFSYHNRTPFSGLENALANCYVNPLLQVLFFCRPMRDLAMTHVPDPDAEFSLMGELSLLFRMLATAGGSVCQAANLLRALRQSKEALALGLLEGVRGERGSSDIEVEAQKDKSLPRRVQRLCRFLMEHLTKETSPTGVATRPSTVLASSMLSSHQRTPLEDIFAVMQRQRTQCFSRPRPDQVKDTRAFQVDLQYPPAKERPGSSTSDGAGGGTCTSSSAAAAAAEPPPPRPTFSQLLGASLHTVSQLRAWFDEVVNYQIVRQERYPTALPQVLVVNCGMEDRGDLAWWQPVEEEETEAEREEERSAAAASAAAGEDPAAPRRKRQRAWLPAALSITLDPATGAVAMDEGTSGEALLQRAAPPDAVRAVYELTAVIAHVVDADEAAEGGTEYEGHLLAHIRVPGTYYSAQQESPMASKRPSRGPDAANPAAAAAAAAEFPEVVVREDPAAQQAQAPSGAVGLDPGESAEERVVSVDLPGSPPVTPATTKTMAAAARQVQRPQRQSWLLFNDFHIAPCLPDDVTEMYSGQKVPVLLFFTRVEELKKAAMEPPVPPVSVLAPEDFVRLCRAPPIQHNRSRLLPPTFVPLSPDELPRPGQLFSLDAEFVEYSPAEHVVRRGIEVEARPPRLGLGRVSVVRAEGPSTGVPCIDDHIRSVEPVHDHLTRFSGLVPGDLDPTTSRHHLTTLRRAYLKLRYLVDAGAVFVGHGLKKDFHMLNIVVPPEQIVDTVDLFYSGRRRLSLRFLSSYLLGATIQGRTHDSIEDAVAALKLYEVYRNLVEEGRFDSALQEMFDWGNAHGWDPAAWQSQPPHLTQAQVAREQAKQETVAQQQAVQVRQLQAVLQQQLLQRQQQQQQQRQLANALQHQMMQQQRQRGQHPHHQQQFMGGGGGARAPSPRPEWSP